MRERSPLRRWLNSKRHSIPRRRSVYRRSSCEEIQLIRWITGSSKFAVSEGLTGRDQRASTGVPDHLVNRTITPMLRRDHRPLAPGTCKFSDGIYKQDRRPLGGPVLDIRLFGRSRDCSTVGGDGVPIARLAFWVSLTFGPFAIAITQRCCLGGTLPITFRLDTLGR